MSLEEYLELTDEEINYIVSLDFGESATNPWTGSVLPSNSKSLKLEIESQDEDEASFDMDIVDFDEFLDIPEGFDSD